MDRDGNRPSRHPPTLPFAATQSARPARESTPPISTHKSFDSGYTIDAISKTSSRPLPSPSDTLSAVPILAAGYAPGPSVQFSHPANAREGGHAASNYGAADVRRKKSLVRPDRERLEPSNRLFNYRAHAAAMEADGTGRVNASATGHLAINTLRRGKSILAREDDLVDESGQGILKRGQTLRRKGRHMPGQTEDKEEWERQRKAKGLKEPISPWMIYCKTLTCMCPSFLLRGLGMRTPERQQAWREKIGLLGIIAILMTGVGFLTFGFTRSVCGKPPLRYLAGTVEGGSMIYNGYDYAMDKFTHPGVPGLANGTNPLYSNWNAGGKDGSFLFQNVNQACKGIITAAPGSGIPNQNGDLGWYFPCNIFSQYGDSVRNLTGYTQGVTCHTQSDARQLFYEASYQSGGVLGMMREGPVYYTWDQLNNVSRNLAVYDGNVIDLSLLNWLDSTQVSFPSWFNDLKVQNGTFNGTDITASVVRLGQRAMADCLVDTIRVGFIDSDTIGCFASSVVLYLSLIFIIGVVAIKFGLAVIFNWVVQQKMGAFRGESAEQRRARAAEIEQWTDDIYKPAPSRYRPNVNNKRKSMLPSKSRFSVAAMTVPQSKSSQMPGSNRNSMYGTTPLANMRPTSMASGKMLGSGMKNSPPGSPHSPGSSSSLVKDGLGSRRSSMSLDELAKNGFGHNCPFPLDNVVPQPPRDFEPFKFPLVYSICLVTAYSESVEGLRTTLDSLATTDYPNSHKVIMVIADGMVKGSGNTMTTPEIVLTMMKEFVVPVNEVQALPYIAIADGHKRNNLAKVYAGFYDYDNNTVEGNKQQRVPIILVAKVGNPLEAHDAKPGNRGKRDSQVLLMAFLQKVLFDERMTLFEYEFFNSWWRCTGISPDHYEVVLMVDADTKVFPDSLTRMAATMVQDPEIMGLCGETKIANKSETWVTMIQVFEYYISHHQIKAFESMFGGVTCLPGCFSMYRIKSPKGSDGYWIPILANPDIVERYSENVVDTLHKKNLLLLGEDRYLSTIMLMTFPKRKMIFCPQAVCKTVVPDTFRVLLSQRRRWINSTVHNLFELLFVRDLCGTFCFSMQFVVAMDLMGTLVLPAAISFTIYLLVITAIPGTSKPVIPLILLGIILGLPAVLIIVTSRRIQYVGWMLLYLLSLPVWNGVLPLYAYLHMDDFSWGQTRVVAGEKKGGAHGDKEGEFDSTHIVMKRWAEFERDRRWREAQRNRESFHEIVPRASSPQRPNSNRHSIISSSDTWSSHAPHSDRLILRDANASAQPQLTHLPSGSFVESESGHYTSNPRHSVPILELPAPLAAQTGQMSMPLPRSQTASIDHSFRSTPDMGSLEGDPFEGREELADALPGVVTSFSAHSRYDTEEEERQAMLSSRSPPWSPSTEGVYTDEPEDARHMGGSSSEGELSSAHRSRMKQNRGVSLYDAGPVAAPGGTEVRVVQRARRISTQGRRASSTIDSLISPSSGGYNSSPRSPSFPTVSEVPHAALQHALQLSESGPRPSLPPGAAPSRSMAGDGSSIYGQS